MKEGSRWGVRDRFTEMRKRRDVEGYTEGDRERKRDGVSRVTEMVFVSLYGTGGSLTTHHCDT